MLLCFTGSLLADTVDWWDGTGPAPGQTSRDRDWFNPANWVWGANTNPPPGVPTAATEVRMHRSSAAPYDLTCIIAAGGAFNPTGDAYASVINIGGNSLANGSLPYGRLTIDSGSLTVGNGLRVGGSSSSKRSGEFFVNGGVVNATSYLAVGYGPSAGGNSGWMHMTNGIVNAGQFDIGRIANVNGSLDMTGGIINCNEFRIKPAGGAGTALVDISGSAQIVIVGDVRSTIYGYIDSGYIKTLGVDISYDNVQLSQDGTHTIIAVPEPATLCLLGLGALGLIRRK